MVSHLEKKTVIGVSWVLIERFGIQGMRFVLGILLARLLTPADFGLIAMIYVFFAVAEVFVNGGLGAAYIQKKEITAYDSDTVFYFNLVISIAIYGILWISAPAIAGFYGQPALIELIRVMALVIIINAFNIIQMAQVMRNIDFKRRAKVTLIATFTSGIAGIAAAYLGCGVWSLVIQQMANRFLITSGLMITSKWKPGLKFSLESLKDLFSYGFWILAAGLIRTIFDNIYLLTIGKFFPSSQLGFYSKAKQFKVAGAQEVSSAVGTVAFPVLSKLQEDKPKLKEAVRKFLTHTLMFVVPLMVLLIVVGKAFITLLLTDKWTPMVPYLQLLCITGILYPLHAVNVQVLKAQGRSDLNFRLAVIKNILSIVNIVVMYRWGVIYIIIGEIIADVLSLIINTFYTKRLLDYGIIEQLKDIKQILLSAAISGIAGYIIIYHIINLYLNIFVGSIVVLLVYIALQYNFNKSLFFQIVNLKDSFVK